MDDPTTTVSEPSVRALTLPQVVTVKELARQKHKHDNTKNNVNFILLSIYCENTCDKRLKTQSTIDQERIAEVQCDQPIYIFA